MKGLHDNYKEALIIIAKCRPTKLAAAEECLYAMAMICYLLFNN